MQGVSSTSVQWQTKEPAIYFNGRMAMKATGIIMKLAIMLRPPPGGDMLDHHVVNLVNRRNFGLSSFRSGQKEIIENALMLRDVFV